MRAQSSRAKLRPLLVLVMLISASQVLSITPKLSIFEGANKSTNNASWNFNGGANSSVLLPVAGDSDGFAHQPGFRVDNASMNVRFSPDRIWVNNSINLNQGGLGLYNNTSVTNSGIALLNNATHSSIYAGTTNLTLFNMTTLSGNLSFDVVHLMCGIVSCGQIVANGSLTIHANQIILEAGTSILAEAMYWGGSGSGTSVQQSSSGSSDGAGGAGHHSSGGAGGGYQGTVGNGGSSYGNGSESGSSGGNVSSSSSNVLSSGGRGGGLIQLYSNSITVNGTISVNGEDGDAGVIPTGGNGPGSSGAGGGSGGSLLLLANTISVGNSGSITSDGGDGGDGSNGQCATGPCLFMYNGGNGGGGGSGGYIKIFNSSNGLSNSGVISALGGSGGLGGLAYGTGTAGGSGASGGSGQVSYSNIGNATGPEYASIGYWTSDRIYTSGQIVENVRANFSYNLLPQTNLSLEYRFTIDNTSWSEWQSADISNISTNRIQGIQFRVSFTTSDETKSPRLSSLNMQYQRWDSLENLNLSLASQNLLGPANIGVSNQSNLSNNTIRLMDLPVNGISIDDAFLLLTGFSSSGENLELELGGVTLLDIATSEIPTHGLDLRINRSVLNAAWPTSGNTGLDGIERGSIDISVLSPVGQYTLSLSDSRLAYEYQESLDLKPAMDAHVVSVVGDWYNATGNILPSFDLTIDGDAEVQNTEFILEDLQIDWIDDMAPVLNEAWFEDNGNKLSTFRIGSNVEIYVKDWIAETNLVVESWLLEHPLAVDLTTVVTLGSSTTAGSGASDIQNTAYVPLLEDWLQQNNSQLNIINHGQGGARVSDYQSKLPQILAAQPQVVTFLPFGDYASTPVSQWWSDYVPLLEEIEDSGAHIMFFDQRVDPAYVCGNGSGPGGCYSASEAHMINQKNDAIAAIGANLSNFTLIPFYDTNAAHPEWNAPDGHPNDTGHAEIAQRFKDAFTELLQYHYVPHSPAELMTYDSASKGYFSTFDSSGLEPTIDHQRWLSIRLTDSLGNSVFHGSHSVLELIPERPLILDMQINSSNGPLDSDLLNSRWLHNQSLEFTVQVATDRPDLNLTVALTNSDSTVETLQLIWDSQISKYSGVLPVSRSHLGIWDVEVNCIDEARSESDPNGLRSGLDARIEFIDLQAPILTSVHGDWREDVMNIWRTSVQWNSENGENISGSVTVSKDDGSHYRTLLLVVDSEGSGHADLSTESMEPGIYGIDVAIVDELGNIASDFIVATPDTYLTIEAPIPEPWSIIGTPVWDGWNLTINGTVYNESDQEVTLQLLLNDSQVEVVEFEINGNEWSIDLDMRSWLAGEYRIDIITCDLENKCSTNSTIIDSTLALSTRIYANCSTLGVNSDGVIDTTECQVSNDADWGSMIRIRLMTPAPLGICTEQITIDRQTNITFQACRLLDDARGNMSLGFYVEALDVLGEWVIIEQHETILRGPPEEVEEVTEEPDEQDNSTSQSDSKEASAESVNMALWGTVVATLVAVAIAFMAISRKGSNDLEGEAEFWSNEDSPETALSSDQDLVDASISTPNSLSQDTESSKLMWVENWEKLPPGGSYTSNEAGQWYQDGDGDWWFSSSDGSWSRNS